MKSKEIFPEIILIGENFPVIKNWAANLEEGAIEQAVNMAKLPHVFHHIAIMADAHQGYGVPIGGVLAMLDHVIPNAVGVDIGCGVQAVKFPLTKISTEALKEIMGQIREAIPVGFNWHDSPPAPERMPVQKLLTTKALLSELPKANLQLGTLGGGNHFIEIQQDEENHIWAMVHSGSRNLGKKTADYHHEIAKDKAEQMNMWLPDSDLAYLNIKSPAGQAYLADMDYCLAFAKANRTLMMDNIIKIIQKITRCSDIILFRHDIHHNYAVLETHFGQEVIVHRKGATSAYAGETGIIPGSQGTASYIVEGLGNPDSFKSCSHGAGRTMSRGQARKTLNLAEEIARLDEKGIIHSIRNQKDLDEAASAYKDIEEVMNNQIDLVRPIYKLVPLAVIKG